MVNRLVRGGGNLECSRALLLCVNNPKGSIRKAGEKKSAAPPGGKRELKNELCLRSRRAAREAGGNLEIGRAKCTRK